VNLKEVRDDRVHQISTEVGMHQAMIGIQKSREIGWFGSRNHLKTGIIGPIFWDPDSSQLV
jgi:hypothetical protein